MHAGLMSPTDNDELDPSYISALTSYAAAFQVGIGTGGNKLRSQKQDETITAHVISSYVTTRTLKRRGKKKK
jgi:hypothetical protein